MNVSSLSCVESKLFSYVDGKIYDVQDVMIMLSAAQLMTIYRNCDFIISLTRYLFII